MTENMEIRDFLLLLVRNFFILLFSTIIGFGSALYYNNKAIPIYKAEIQLFVSTPASAIDIGLLATGSSFSQERVKSYADIIDGPATLDPVIKKLKLKINAQELARNVRAMAPIDTVLISVTVTDTNPKMAARIANEIGKQFSNTVDQLEIPTYGYESPVKVKVVKQAIPPNSPTSPKKILNLLFGLLLGFGIGMSFSIVRLRFDDSIRNEDQLEGLPLLAAIGYDPEASSKPLLSQISRFSSRSEAFRQLRTNIEYMRAGHAPQVISVTSPLPGEGKTTTSINLALALAETGYETVLIEADMRRPSVSNYLVVDHKMHGLSNLLSNFRSQLNEKVITKSLHATDNQKLKLLTSGEVPPNPVELLDSDKFRKLLKILRKNFQFIIIDTPPLLPVTDGAVVAVQSDGVLLVLKAGSTKINQFKGAVDILSKVGAKINGIALNMIPLSRNGYAYGYRHTYSYGYKRKYGVYGTTGYSGVKLSAPLDLPYAPTELTEERIDAHSLQSKPKSKPKPFEEPGVRPLTRLEKLLAEEKANH